MLSAGVLCSIMGSISFILLINVVVSSINLMNFRWILLIWGKKGLMFKPIVFCDSQMLEHSTIEHYCRSVRIESINKQIFGEGNSNNMLIAGIMVMFTVFLVEGTNC